MLRRQILDKGSVLELNPYVKGEGESGYDVIPQPTTFRILECISEKGGSSLVYRAADIFGKTVLLKEFYPVFMGIERNNDGHLIAAGCETEEYKLRRESFLRGLELQNKLRENGEKVRGDITFANLREKDPQRCVNRFISIDGIYVDKSSETPEGAAPVLYAVMPEFRGIDFEELYDNNIDLEMFLRVLISLNEALFSIEQLGYYYIDIKPDNFRVALFDDDTLAVTLFDFDSIVPVEEDKKQNVRVTYSEEWGAPELGAHEISDKSMVFSVGVMLFRKLFGEMPGIDDTDIRLGRWHFDELDPRLTAYSNLKPHEQEMKQDISVDPVTEEIKANYRLEEKSPSEEYIENSHSDLQRVFYLIRRCLVKSLAYDPKVRTDLSVLSALLRELRKMLVHANKAIAEQAEKFIELCRHHDKEMDSITTISYPGKYIDDLNLFNERKGESSYVFYYPKKDYEQVENLAKAKQEVNRGEQPYTHMPVETAITDKVICAFEFMYYQFQYNEETRIGSYKVAPHWIYNKKYFLNPGALRLRKIYPVLYADLITAAAKVYLDRGRTDGIYNDPMDALELLREARTIYDKELFYNRFIAVRSDEDRLKEAECDMRICEAIMKISRSCNNDTQTILTRNMWFESARECAEDIQAYAKEALELFPNTEDASALKEVLKNECFSYFEETGDRDKARGFK